MITGYVERLIVSLIWYICYTAGQLTPQTILLQKTLFGFGEKKLAYIREEMYYFKDYAHVNQEY